MAISVMARQTISYGENRLIRDVYLQLLKLPPGALRVRLQPVLATLLEEVADAAGEPAEYVQDTFERFAREFP